MNKRKTRSDKVFSDKKRRVPIDKLLAYWIDIKTRDPNARRFSHVLTYGRETFQYFVEYYGWYRGRQIERDKFFGQIYFLVCRRDKIFKTVQTPSTISTTPE